MTIVLVTGTPKSGKTTAAKYLAEKLNLLYFRNIISFIGHLSQNKILDLDSEESKYILDIKNLYQSSLVHIHIYHQAVEFTLNWIDFLSESTIQNIANQKATYLINNNPENDKFIFQLSDVAELIELRAYNTILERFNNDTTER